MLGFRMRDGRKPYGATREKGRSRKNHENWKSVFEGCPRRSAVNERANHPVALEPIKTEGSTGASAAVASLITVDKVSGLSRVLRLPRSTSSCTKNAKKRVEIARK
jgi:hypothetical protein